MGRAAFRIVSVNNMRMGVEILSFRVKPLDKNGEALFGRDAVDAEQANAAVAEAVEGANANISGNYEGAIDVLEGLSIDDCDGDRDHLTIKNGVLVSDGPSDPRNQRGGLFLPGNYRNFRFRLAYRAIQGVYHGVTVRNQIDPPTARNGAKIDCEAAKGDRQNLGTVFRLNEDDSRSIFHPSLDRREQIVAARAGNGEPPGWDVLEVAVIGQTIRTFVNGVFANKVRLEKLPETGRLGVIRGDNQGGPTRLEIRDWRILELPSADEDAPVWQTFEDSALDDGGWVDLFDGRSLAGWTGDTNVWQVRDGMLVGRDPRTTDEVAFELNHFAHYKNSVLQVSCRANDWYHTGLTTR
ncbi:MAG: family 16 glycoside hydrolase, partial [Planctomycetota bacterium]